jgi:hypothetical protein
VIVNTSWHTCCVSKTAGFSPANFDERANDFMIDRIQQNSETGGLK